MCSFLSLILSRHIHILSELTENCEVRIVSYITGYMHGTSLMTVVHLVSVSLQVMLVGILITHHVEWSIVLFWS